MVFDKVCLNCNKKFTPSKNDKRIKFCSELCRREYRNKTNYMKSYYNENIDKWKDRQSQQSYKDTKNETRKTKYHTDADFRQRVIDRSKQYRIDHPTAKRSQDLYSKYGMTLQEYDEMLKNQDGKCAICGMNAEDNGRYGVLYVDHNHQTGKIRGLLCENCNFGLGIFKDNIDILNNAVKYLEDNS